ncbi:MAG TPA: MBOAT family O-acyltransferase [Bacteroidales bacterium]|nr:MBOAT family O-acyltransferase [Bacteroidales bacterium]
MKPYKTLILLLVFLVFFFGPSWFVTGPVKIAPGINFQLPDLPGLKQLIKEQVALPEDTGAIGSDQIPVSFAQEKPAADFTGTDPGVQLIVSPDSESPVVSFLDSILCDEEQIRILYYGDSQLEGDRITDWLREKFRSISGGSGPGLLSPTMLVPYTRTAYVRASPNWIRFNWLSYRNRDIPHRNLGPLLHVSRFLPAGVVSEKEKEAWIRVAPSSFADSAAARYELLRLFYGNLTDSLKITITTDDRPAREDILVPVSGVAEYRASLDDAGSVSIQLKGRSSPDIYGFSLESDSGIIIDNIPSRGSAGLEFSLLGDDNLRELYTMLDPNLIILHYGLNVVMNIREDYTFYEEGLVRQMETLKRLNPDADILVIGLTDMARFENGEFRSYPNIPLIRDAQRRAAGRAGIYFWDSWEAMGGYDGIIAWRDSVPALAASDYTHLSYEGGHQLASMLTDAMRYDPGTIADREMVASEKQTPGDEIVISDGEESGIKRFIVGLIEFNPDQQFIFTTISFWIFIFLLLAGYSMIFNKPVFRNSYLFLLSLFFYYKSGGLFFFLLIVSTITDYLAGLLIYNSGRVFFKRFFVFISLLVNLGMLAYFKYASFITGAVNNLLNISIPDIDWLASFSNSFLGTSFDVSMIILPIGISFFTFQTISYTIDVYRGKSQPVRNILDFGFYVSFFPQLVAGPIIRASEFIPQLYAPFSLNKREWGHALFLIINGLIKKIVVSDFISLNFVDRVFTNPHLFSGFENLLAVYGYGLQIYCDFSGYTDIAIGIALMLGFRLAVNFNSPYKAGNITDFWRRWHISLSRWLKDYLYISMGGNRKGKIRTHVNLLITMLLGGLWHGAAWRFVIWGGLHGTGLMFHKLWVRIFPGKSSRSVFSRFLSVFITFNFVSICWIFFRAESMDKVKTIFSQMLHGFYPGNLADVILTYSAVLVTITAGYILHWLPVKVKESYRGLFIRLPLMVKLLIVYLAGIIMFNMQSLGIQPFIYFRF